jgi:hypothetical protein
MASSTQKPTVNGPMLPLAEETETNYTANSVTDNSIIFFSKNGLRDGRRRRQELKL